MIRDWEGKLKDLFDSTKLANGHPLTNGHAHRFRDTFAVELLLVAVPLERVSILLGHSTIKITERHYAPWVRARQEQLERDVCNSWTSPMRTEQMLLALGKSPPQNEQAEASEGQGTP